jgi:hypothetical protein
VPSSLEDLTVDQLRARAAQLESQAGLLQLLVGNPDTRETVQRALKKLRPELVIPEIDATDRVMKRLDEIVDDNKKLRGEILEKDIRGRLERERSGVQAKYKLNDEDMKGVEALMVDKENPIPTYEAAAMVYRAQRVSAVPSPSTFRPPVFEMPEKELWGKGIGHKALLDRIALNEAWAAIGDLQSGKVPGLGAARA